MKPLAFAVPARIDRDEQQRFFGTQGWGRYARAVRFVVSCRGRTANVEGMRCSACNWARCRVLCDNNDRTKRELRAEGGIDPSGNCVR